MITTDYSKQAEFIKAWYAKHFPHLTVVKVTPTMELTAEDDITITDSKFCVSYTEGLDRCQEAVFSDDWVCKGPSDLEPMAQHCKQNGFTSMEQYAKSCTL